MWRSLIVTAALFGGSVCASAQDVPESLEDCGYTFAVDSYTARVSGLDIRLTANDRLLVNERVLVERSPWRQDRPPLPWGYSSNTAEIAIGRGDIVVRTGRTDCIDAQATRIYVVSARGELRAAFTFPYAWERAVISYRADNIVYAADYSCTSQDGAPDGQAWTHVLRPGAREFVREARPRAEVCDGGSAKASGLLLFFMPMQPVTAR
ncbi:MAG: hypothetical protein NT015_11645 [Alphaproteobacteria bacterium]|nr:hypothetical protein [Alphaproteobacteria bacterium]